jgi:TonB family protein
VFQQCTSPLKGLSQGWIEADSFIEVLNRLFTSGERDYAATHPEPARQQHVQGPVELKVLVGTDGLVRSLTTISGDPLLVSAATDAVRQWKYKPYFLNGEPVEVETQVTVNFKLP